MESLSLNEKVRAYLNEKNETILPFLHLLRHIDKTISMPQAEIPYIYFILDGEFRLYTPGGILDYVSGQYSVSAVDTPEQGYVLAFS